MPRPTVLISSTVSGFEDLRGALYYELSRRGFQPWLSEEPNFPVSGEGPALAECLEIARSVDYYLLLLGSQRGFKMETGSSPTREEFRAAAAAQQASRRPRLILTVRTSTRDAVERWKLSQQGGELDDPQFTSGFVDEVEGGNYLARFGSFTDLMAILETQLQLGANDGELVARQSVLDEVLDNVAMLVYRHRSSAKTLHTGAGLAHQQLEFGDDVDLAGYMDVTRDVANLLVSAMSMHSANRLRTTALQSAQTSGVFRRYDTETQSFVPGPLHAAIGIVLSDIGYLQLLTASDMGWFNPLGLATADANERQSETVAVPVHSVINALAYYDRAENVFQGLVALARYLLGLSDNPNPGLENRRPQSPVPRMDEGLKAEHVERAEVERLIRNQILPFGSRVPPDIFSKAEIEELISDMTERVVEELRTVPGMEALNDGDILTIASTGAPKVVLSHVASADEGIDVRHHPNRTNRSGQAG